MLASKQMCSTGQKSAEPFLLLIDNMGFFRHRKRKLVVNIL